MNEIEMLEEVQKELSKQYLEVSRLEHENEKLKKVLKDCKKMFLKDCQQMFVGKSLLVRFSRLEDIKKIVKKINEVLNDTKAHEIH